MAAARAHPMAPDERRAAIVAAVTPLVAARGHDVTSRELAEAARVAEGTLFRAFGDKLSLVGEVAFAALERAVGAESLRAELVGIDRDEPLVDRLTQVVEIGRSRTADVVRWTTVLRQLHLRSGGRADPDDERVRPYRERIIALRAEQRSAFVTGLREVLEPDAGLLRVPIDVVVAVVESVIVGPHMPFEMPAPQPEAREVADALVHGVVGQAPREVR